MKLRNEMWGEDKLLEKRKEVLKTWPTGSEISLEEAVEYRKGLDDGKKLVNLLDKALTEGRTLIVPHIGHTTVRDTIEHFKVAAEAGADFVVLCTDTYSRQGRYDLAERGLQESLREGKDLLNGFPLVNHGLHKARELRESVDVPISVVDSGGDQECMLLAEMSMAAGFEHSSNGIESLLRTGRDFPLERKIIETKYADRLAGYYTERGAPVQVSVVAHLSGLDPPGMKVVIAVLQSLLAVGQGVKHICLSMSASCHLIQDTAMFTLAKEMTREYLTRFGYEAVVSAISVGFLGPWPTEPFSAAAATALSSAIPMLAGADWIWVKSIAEALAVPTKEANVAAINVAKKVRDVFGSQRLFESLLKIEEVKLEKEMLELEVRAVLEKTLELGDGDPATGVDKALESGVIDMQFSPYRKVRGIAFPLRDNTGAIRYLRHGNIPLPPEVVEYHRERIARREREEQKRTFAMMTADVAYLSG